MSLKNIMITLMIAALIIVSGCGQMPPDNYIPPGADMVIPEDTQQEIIAAPEEIKNAADANSQFAIDMYLKFSEEDGNIFFSPYSISTAIAMAYEGAKGETASQIADVFYFSGDDKQRRESFQAIQGIINRKSDMYQLNTANAMWAQQDYPFLENYTSKVVSTYLAPIAHMDFKTNPEGSRQAINKWVEEKTNNKITDLLPQGSITDITRLVLTNAVYFKGEWVKKFDKRDTRNMPFRINEEESVDVPMMKRTDRDARFNYAQEGSLQILEMMYDGSNLSMVVLLPELGGMESLEKNLTAENIELWKSMMHERKIDVYFPKFEMTEKYSLKDSLSAMGIEDAFNPEKADFSGIDGTRFLFISDVFHKAYVKVDEEGTEAAAATGVVVGATAIMDYFMADHPFIFLIQEKTTGTILFMGKVVNPLG